MLQLRERVRELTIGRSAWELGGESGRKGKSSKGRKERTTCHLSSYLISINHSFIQHFLDCRYFEFLSDLNQRECHPFQGWRNASPHGRNVLDEGVLGLLSRISF